MAEEDSCRCSQTRRRSEAEDKNMVAAGVEGSMVSAGGTNDNLLMAEKVLLTKGNIQKKSSEEESRSDEATAGTIANALIAEKELTSKGIIQNSQAPISQPGAVAVGATLDRLMTKQESHSLQAPTSSAGAVAVGATLDRLLTKQESDRNGKVTNQDPGYLRYALDATNHSSRSQSTTHVTSPESDNAPSPSAQPSIAQPGAFPQAGMNARANSSSSVYSYYYNNDVTYEQASLEPPPAARINENNEGLVQANIVRNSQNYSRLDLEIAEPIPEMDEENPSSQLERLKQKKYQRYGIGGCVLLFLVVVVVATSIVLTRSSNESSTNQSAAADNTLGPTLAAPLLLALLPNSTQSVILKEIYPSSSSSQPVEPTTLSPPSLAYLWMVEDPNLENYNNNRLLQRFAMASLYYSTDGPNWEHQGGGTVAIFIEGFQQGKPGPGSEFMPLGDAPHLQAGAREDPFAGPAMQGGPDGSQMPPHPQPGATGNMQGGPLQGGPPQMQGGPPQGGPPHMQGGPPQGGPPQMQGGPPQGGPPHMQGGPPQGGPPHMQGGPPQGGPPGGPPMQGGPSGSPHSFAELGMGSSHPSRPGETLWNKTSAAWLDYNSHECNWLSYGVDSMCPQDNETLINFKMRHSNLGGSLPDEVGLLSSLLDLEITYNNLGGRIPSHIGLLTNLQRLILDSNHVSGAIPPGIGSMKSLNYLNLKDNHLIGSLPTQFWKLSQLSKMKTRWNQLTGSIPTDLGLLPNIRSIEMADNLHTGSLPSSIGQCTHLQQLVVDRNFLTGSLPTELGLVTDLYQLSMNKNLLVERLPSELGMLQSLHTLSLRGNVGLSGTIPAEWNLLNSSLMMLDLSGTSIEGTIPPNLCSVEELLFDCSASLCGCSSCPCNMFNIST